MATKGTLAGGGTEAFEDPIEYSTTLVDPLTGSVELVGGIGTDSVELVAAEGEGEGGGRGGALDEETTRGGETVVVEEADSDGGWGDGEAGTEEGGAEGVGGDGGGGEGGGGGAEAGVEEATAGTDDAGRVGRVLIGWIGVTIETGRAGVELGIKPVAVVNADGGSERYSLDTSAQPPGPGSVMLACGCNIMTAGEHRSSSDA